eukprot:1150706-Pelagomonas_calceolata.AAC.4
MASYYISDAAVKLNQKKDDGEQTRTERERQLRLIEVHARSLGAAEGELWRDHEEAGSGGVGPWRAGVKGSNVTWRPGLLPA